MHKTLAAPNHKYQEQGTTDRQPLYTNGPSSPTEGTSNGDKGLEREEDNPYSKYLQRYVGVDELLIFAGLFGEILTAFMIESRKNLQVDPLQEILQALQNPSL
ncbi:hypothetical protein BU17DRAFT_82942 [Hysterangium stoloniferum]|nr:hypothetical protein BU17DRAFT_82942 [Hysterangium stoloniferum]